MTFNVKGLMSSINQDWKTPEAIFRALNQEFHFDDDPCPTDFMIDGLSRNWGKCSFVNPPYKQIKLWIKKGYEEWQKGKTVVFLIPARTDTKYFHEYIYGKAELRFIKGRLRFNDGKTGAPFPSMIAILKSHFFEAVPSYEASVATEDESNCKVEKSETASVATHSPSVRKSQTCELGDAPSSPSDASPKYHKKGERR